MRAVSRNRGVKKNHVTQNFGKGGILTAREFFLQGGIDSISHIGHSYTNANNTGGNKAMSTATKNKKKFKSELVIVDDEQIEIPDDAEATTLDQVTADWVKENLPDVAQELISEGAEGSGQTQEEPENPEEEMESQKEGGLSARALVIKNIKAINNTETFTDQEVALKQKAINKSLSHVEFLTELTTIRAKNVSTLIRANLKDSNDLDGVNIEETEPIQVTRNKKALISLAKSQLKNSLKSGGIN